MNDDPEKQGDDEDLKGRVRQWLLRILRIAALSYIGFIIVLKLLENRMVYLPSPWPKDIVIELPDYIDDISLQSPDGEVLHAWHLRHEQPKAHVMFFHGNAGNLIGRRFMLQHLHDYHQVDVFALDYRGYGKSTGRPSEVSNMADARLARSRYASLAGIPESEIVLMGRSLGGGVAVDLAAGEGARGLILQSTFSSLPEVAALQYPWLPVRWLMSNRYNSVDKIGDYSGPILQSHSETDTIIPFGLAEKLFAAAQEPKRFIRFSDLDHNDSHPPKYHLELAAFLESLD